MTEPSYEELKARLADLEKQVETKKKPVSSIFA
jgi:PHD/YefM family antitoxin component YafN of YafNO toxin-antitoxin module